MQEEFGNETQVEADAPHQIDITEAIKNSPVLARLVEEVRIEKFSGPYSYNRMHNRHNRSR
jgi:hypothetical protein